MRLPGLLTGVALAVSAQLAGAQTLAEIQDLMKQGKMPQALEKADLYIAAQPRDAQGPFTKGLILTELGRPDEAIAVFTGLTENFPELPEPYNNLAVLYARQKQYDKARTALEMAIRTHPGYAVAYENLGDIHAKLASQFYDKSLQLDAAGKTARAKLTMANELVKLSTGPTPGPAAAAPRSATVQAAVPAQAGEPASVLTEVVQDWMQAWSRKDLNAYLAFYADDFQTPKGMSRREWEDERRQRLDKPGSLQVTASDVRVSVAGETATVRFHEEYASPTFKSSAEKTLVFVKSGGRWLIRQESVS